MNAAPDNTMLSAGTISVPSGSMCASGESVTRSSAAGVSSPSRVATIACANSWTESDRIIGTR